MINLDSPGMNRECNDDLSIFFLSFCVAFRCYSAPNNKPIWTMETFLFTFMSLFILWISWLHQITDLWMSRITFISFILHAPDASSAQRGEKIGEKPNEERRKCLIVKCRIQWNNDFTSHKSHTGERHFSFYPVCRFALFELISVETWGREGSWDAKRQCECEYWKYTTRTLT